MPLRQSGCGCRLSGASTVSFEEASERGVGGYSSAAEQLLQP